MQPLAASAQSSPRAAHTARPVARLSFRGSSGLVMSSRTDLGSGCCNGYASRALPDRGRSARVARVDAHALPLEDLPGDARLVELVTAVRVPRVANVAANRRRGSGRGVYRLATSLGLAVPRGRARL